MRTYEGYFENGEFYSKGRLIKLPERKSVVITSIEPPEEIKLVQHKSPQERLAAMRSIRGVLKGCVDESVSEKDIIAEAMLQKYESID